jgi:hypothetical protein
MHILSLVSFEFFLISEDHCSLSVAEETKVVRNLEDVDRLALGSLN